MIITILPHFFHFLFLVMSLLYLKAIPREYIILPKVIFEYWTAENFSKPMKDIIHADSKSSTIPKQNKIHIWILRTETTEYQTKRKFEKQPGAYITCSRPCKLINYSQTSFGDDLVLNSTSFLNTTLSLYSPCSGTIQRVDLLTSSFNTGTRRMTIQSFTVLILLEDSF